MKIISHEIDPQSWTMCAREMNEAKVVRPIAEKWAKKFGLAPKTIYKNALRHGYLPKKKKRNDAGRLLYSKVQPDINEHLWKIAVIYHTVPNKLKSQRAESGTPLEMAIEEYVDSLPYNIQLPCTSRIAQIFRQWDISKSDALKETSKRKLISRYPNNVHQYDTSVCRYYLEPDNTILYISKSEDYPGKPWKKKRRLVRHILIDHTTGAFYVEYSFHQKIPDYERFLYNAWKIKEQGYIFHGAPEMLIIDHDSGLRSHALMRLFSNLQIEVPKGKPYSPWEKGTVENFMRTWERWFESRFLFQQSGDLDQINQWAYDYAVRFQKTKKHRRHGTTRFHAWDSGITGHLREIPDEETFIQLCHTKPKPAKVKSNREFSFKGVKYEAPAELAHQWVDVIIYPYLYAHNQAVTIFWPSERDSNETFLNSELKKWTILPQAINNYGLQEQAENSVFFGKYKSIEKTPREKQFDKLDQTEVPEINPFDNQREKAGDIEFLPKTGEPILPDSKYSTYSTGQINYTPEQFKFVLRDLLNRRLQPEEARFIDGLKKEVFTDEDLKDFIEKFTTPQKKEESK